MAARKYCPIKNGICEENNCAWYVSVQEQCSILSIAKDLREIAEYLEGYSHAD
jgi:hypothetical protein